jgi:hypothetical protein
MDDEPQPDDLLELGQQRSRLPGLPRWPAWRPSRGAAVFAVAALAVGLAAGYAAGNRHVAPPSKPAAAPAPLPSGTFSFADAAISQGTTVCSTQTRQGLQLGVEVTNQSAVTLVLASARSVLPLGGLKQVGWQWGPCGALSGGAGDEVFTRAGQEEEILAPGQSVWLTATFQVQLRCPAALPVQFAVGYVAQGHSVTASLPGFPDLGQVTYTGCPAKTVSTAAAALGPGSRWREPAAS